MTKKGFFYKLFHKTPDFNKDTNIINIDERINRKLEIQGKNNFIDISCKPTLEPKNINIYIKGNNNKIIIKDLRTANLYIGIGNHYCVENATIEIMENLVCVQASIFAYQNNTPIKIGSNCLFSKDICIRNGESPHGIYDLKTLENLDKSNGVFIGDHVWIGEHSYIMKKAKIANNSIVGAMSVVTKEFNEENVVIAGNPAKICKRNVMWDEDVKNIPTTKPNNL